MTAVPLEADLSAECDTNDTMLLSACLTQDILHACSRLLSWHVCGHVARQVLLVSSTNQQQRGAAAASIGAPPCGGHHHM